MKLDNQQKSLISLYGRSKEDADVNGWVCVSNTLWPWVQKTATPEMFEIGEQKIRLTDAGKVILEYGI